VPLTLWVWVLGVSLTRGVIDWGAQDGARFPVLCLPHLSGVVGLQHGGRHCEKFRVLKAGGQFCLNDKAWDDTVRPSVQRPAGPSSRGGRGRTQIPGGLVYRGFALRGGLKGAINRDDRGHSYCHARGEILGPWQDVLLRKHLARASPLIKNESQGIEDDQIPS